MKVGLVLGAGGVIGGAWLTGGLDAVAKQTGWDPATADVIVGTSAGSMIGGLLSAGIPPWFMVAHSQGESFTNATDAFGRPASEADRSGGAVFKLDGVPLPFPGSLSLALRALLRPTLHSPTAMIAGWLPRGAVSTEPLRRQVRRVVPDGWTSHPEFWAVACDYETGRRTPFGREDMPAADLADAVAASCAIPGFYRPVKIGGRDYVDGGVYSTSNLDLLADRGLDLVICLNPTSTLHPPRAINPATWIGRAFQSASGRLLGSEARRLRDRGTEVLLLQPTAEDLRAMGPNLMSSSRRNLAISAGQASITTRLDQPDARSMLIDLPPGDPDMVRRPEGNPDDSPRLGEIGRRLRARAKSRRDAAQRPTGAG